MRIDIITCQPRLLESPFQYSIIKRAIDTHRVTLQVHDLRKYGIGKHQQIDDRPYGGGAGMVLMIQPIVDCIETLQKERTYDEIIYLAPDGEMLTQHIANQLSLKNNILLLCGHYKGIDERIRTHFITREISIGAYVLSGGELAAAVVVDSLVRLLPGVLSDTTSALTDSYQDDCIAPPIYTRPASFRNMHVPPLLLSGHEAHIATWREEQSVARTKERAPHLLEENRINTHIP